MSGGAELGPGLHASGLTSGTGNTQIHCFLFSGANIWMLAVGHDLHLVMQIKDD